MRLKAPNVILASLAVLMLTAATAEAYSSRVRAACKSDFYRFCPSYKVPSTKLEACMRAAGGNLSTRCIDALVDAGRAPRKYHSSKRRR